MNAISVRAANIVAAGCIILFLLLITTVAMWISAAILTETRAHREHHTARSPFVSTTVFLSADGCCAMYWHAFRLYPYIAANQPQWPATTRSATTTRPTTSPSHRMIDAPQASSTQWHRSRWDAPANPPTSHVLSVAPTFYFYKAQIEITRYPGGGWFVVVPYWLISGVLALPLVAGSAIRWARKRRTRRCVRENRCVRCGYDLRASGDICPECGRKRDHAANR